MAIKEYPRGTAFPGASGARSASRSRPGPSRFGRSPARRTCSSSSSTTPAYGQFGCYGSPIRTPNLDRLAANGLRYTNLHTTALCSPTRSCILTGRNHHSNGMSCITEGADRLSRAATAPSRSRTGSSPRSCWRTATPRTPSASGTSRPPSSRAPPALRPLAAGPRLRALLRLPGRRHPPVLPGPRLRQPPGRAADDARGGLPPHRGPGRSRRSASSPTPSRSRPTSRSSSTSARAPCTRRTTRRREWADKYRGSSTTAGTPTARRCSQRQLELGIVPPDTELSRADPDVAEWDALPDDEKRLYSPADGGVRRIPRAHRPPDRPAARLPGRDRTARQHAHHAGVATTAPAPRAGRTARSTRTCSSTTSPRRLDDGLKASTTWAARSTSTTTRGAGPGPATPRSAAGSGRPTAAAPATRSWSTGRRGSRRGERFAASTRTSSTCCRRCWRRSASRRRGRSAASRSHRSRASRSRTRSTTSRFRRATAPSTSR